MKRGRGRPPRSAAELWLRRRIAILVKAHMDAGMTLERAAEAVSDAAADVALDLRRAWDRGEYPGMEELTPDAIRRVLAVKPTGPKTLWRISPSTAKKAYLVHFGDGSRKKRRNKLT